MDDQPVEIQPHVGKPPGKGLTEPPMRRSGTAREQAGFAQQGDAVIHIQHLATSPEAPFFVPGTEGVEIHATVRPQGDETVVTKHFPNAFRETVLKQVLDARGIDEVVLVGAMSHMCIAATGRAAADFGYKTVVVHDACATRALEFNGTTVPAAQVHAANMAALAFGYAKVIGAAEWIAGEG
ncbi:cysteine hydrolase family protein [Kaistia defluvii]|uniref:cysteine hydrolase family protein n=1 Tax=Kaistia defluvii TaxID=410841 RepID=UPI002255DB83|nr:cysteine hydrolase family protein [Kaistia defluvii]MCX5519203.1 cysteine hydrolase family protein [Kaistia defluvii]